MQLKLKEVWEPKLSYANEISPSKALWFLSLSNSLAVKPHKTQLLRYQKVVNKVQKLVSYENPAFFPGTLTTEPVS